MAQITIPDENKTISNWQEIKDFLATRGILIEQWEASAPLDSNSTSEEILKAYEHKIRPFMDKNKMQSCDVVNIHPGLDNLSALREKFLAEHTHSEDEVRFFVEGEGTFWFNYEEEVFNVKCVAGDFLSVPTGYKHWFDFAPKNFVKAIRIFTSTDGWTPHYTESGVEKSYQ